MNPSERFYIDGRWVEPRGGRVVGVENPATEAPFATVALGCAADADAAVAAARRAFDGFTAWPVADRIALVERVIAAYDRRAEDLAQAVSQEMGAALAFARSSQVPAGRVHRTEPSVRGSSRTGVSVGSVNTAPIGYLPRSSSRT